MDIFIVTGLSGAGRSSALRALEDLGVRCVDNLPTQLLPELVRLVAAEAEDRRLAVGIDSRGLERPEHLETRLDELRIAGYAVHLLFLECSTSTLLQRFSETRRVHPLGELPEAIERERAWLSSLRERADWVIDTDRSSARQLRQSIADRYGRGNLRLVITSFAYKQGVPLEADLVFDARALANPHELAHLRARSGFHPQVREHVLGQSDASAALGLFEAHVRFQLPGSLREGRSHLTVAIGCTGGQHRSVVLCRELVARLRAGPPLAAIEVHISERHRDVDRSRDDA